MNLLLSKQVVTCKSTWVLLPHARSRITYQLEKCFQHYQRCIIARNFNILMKGWFVTRQFSCWIKNVIKNFVYISSWHVCYDPCLWVVEEEENGVLDGFHSLHNSSLNLYNFTTSSSVNYTICKLILYYT